MNLYLMRHAHALDVGEGSIRRDSERPLSNKGLAVARGMARHLRHRGVNLDLIATSPLLRARQTAEIIASELDGVAMVVCPDLAPCVSSAVLPSTISLEALESVMLVGHMPDLCELACTLMLGQPAHAVNFKKAAIGRISFSGHAQPGRGTLDWLITPAMVLDT